jgi:putative transposon-encoded protein
MAPPSRPAKSVATAQFTVQGHEMVEKEVKPAGNSGRIYLPPDWIGKRVKIVRMD